MGDDILMERHRLEIFAKQMIENDEPVLKVETTSPHPVSSPPEKAFSGGEETGWGKFLMK